MYYLCYFVNVTLKNSCFLLPQKLEERRTYQDGYGNKEETVTRGMGDKSHTVTITRTPSGQEERKEDFHNMQESE